MTRLQRRRALAPSPEPLRAAPAASWVQQFQRTAGNRAVGQLLRAPAGISVHEGSTMTAGDFAAKLKKNENVPEWIKQGFGSSGSSLTLGKLAPPSGRIWLFDDALAAAVASGTWEITTATSTITVTDEGGRRSGTSSSRPTSRRASGSAST